MRRYLGGYTAYAYALLRFVSGLLFMMHGTQKLFGFPGNKPPVSLSSLMGVGGIIEFLSGLLIMIGLFASCAAFVASGEMAVAYFMVHFPHHPLPIINQGEPAVLFCFVFLFIACMGSGVLSVDSIRNKQSITSPG